MITIPFLKYLWSVCSKEEKESFDLEPWKERFKFHRLSYTIMSEWVMQGSPKSITMHTLHLLEEIGSS
jgi:hypothetical protein